MSNTLRELKYSILLLFGIIVSIFITAIIPFLLISYINFEIITYVFIYLIVMYILAKIFKKQIFEILYNIPLLPFYVFFQILTYTIPISLILMNVFLYISFPILVVSYTSIVLTHYRVAINYELELYLSFLLVYLFYVTFNKLALLFVAKLSPARYKDSTKLKPYNIKEITEYLLAEDNMKILIYSFNFLVIIFINIYKFQNLNFYDKVLVLEKPILQSLVTFIAFDRAMILFKGLKFKPSELYEKILTGIKNKKESLKQNIR